MPKLIRESCEDAKIRIYNRGMRSSSGKGSNNAIVTEHGTQTKNENHLVIIGVTEMKGGEG